MKKLVLTSAFALAITGAAFAQGTIEWNSMSPADFTAQTNSTTSSYLSTGGVAALQGGTVGSTVAAAGAFYYELLDTTAGTAAPATKSALQAWSDTGLEGQNNAASVGRAVVIGSTPDATVGPAVSTAFMVVGWSSNLGTTWSAAEALLIAGSGWTGTAFFGETPVATITPAPSGTSPGAVMFGPSPEIVSLNTPLYEVTSTPEPTTIALGVMGGLSLLALRRKKA
jgi:hypothetical protein